MRFSSQWRPYVKGTLLEAARLNADFGLGHFVAENLAARFSDGILSGMLVRVRSDSLFLEPGLFRLGELAWLEGELALDFPPPDKWMRLWLKRDGSGRDFSLEWLPEKEEPENALCLCRLHLTSAAVLRDCWLLDGGSPLEHGKWPRILEYAGSPQLEYAMAASMSGRPSLLPAIQRALAPERPQGLRLAMLNGLFPLLDYFGASRWEDALAELANMLAPRAPAAPKRDPDEITMLY